MTTELPVVTSSPTELIRNQRRFAHAYAVLFLVLAQPLQVQAQFDPGAPAGEFAPRVQGIARSSAELLAHPVRRPSAWGLDNLARWSALDRAREDAFTDDLPGMPLRIGVNRPPPQGAIGLHTGRRVRDVSGRFLWTYQLDAPDAKAIRVHFSKFNLPDGAELVVADQSGAVVEVYAVRGPMDGEGFWTPPVHGSIVYMEYRSAVGDPRPPEIEIDQISYLYRDPLPADAAEQNLPTPQPQDHVLSCQVDVNCLEVPPAVRDAVGRMVFTTSSGTFACTGTLLADADPNTSAGYFLTANHCINTPAAAASLAVYWFYQTDACNGVAPVLTNLPRSNGSTLLATSPESDFTLLRLRDDPNAGQGFVGWTTNAPTGQIVSIHHPRGEYKRISVGELTSEQPICGSIPTNRFWYLDWVTGITETGSSGGPLFDSNWRVIGQLFGTCSFSTPTCTNPEDYNVAFGRFSLTYPLIASYLQSIIPDDVYEDNDTPAQAAPIMPGTHALRLVDFADYFSITLSATATITSTAVFSTAEMNLDLALLNANGEVMSLSAGVSGTETVSATVPPGTYRIHASRTNRWGGNYTLTVTVNPESAVSVGPTITAQPTNQTAFVGQGATFSISASGPGLLAYQWYFNQTNRLAQGTDSLLSLGPLLEADGGLYSCVVTNTDGMATSQVAQLTVKIPPGIAIQPADLLVNQGQDATFTVLATGTPPLFYQWYFNGTGEIAGATNSSLVITNAQDANAGAYSVVVSNGMTVASFSAVLSINHLPVPASPRLQRFYGQGVKVRAAALLGSDSNGDTLSLSALAPASVLGVPVTANDGWIFYSPPVGLIEADSFSYTVSDGRGGFATGTVSIVMTTSPAASLNLAWAGSTNNATRVTGSGIPGRSYTIEFSESLQTPVWQALGVVVANSFGVFEYLDYPPPEAPLRLYRAATP